MIGFARRRAGNVFRPATGDVAVSVVAQGKTLVSAHADLDKAGAFATSVVLPVDAPAGDAAILASMAGASGGATIHVDATGTVAIGISAACSTACPATIPIPLTVTARHGDSPAPGVDVNVRIVRSPHIRPPDADDTAVPWGVTTIVDTTLHTDALGVAHVAIPAPTDGLASTYAVSAGSGASTASTTLVAPTARLALAVTPAAGTIDAAAPASVTVRGFDALQGAPAAGVAVRLRVAHGPIEQTQTVTLGPDGTAAATFRDVALGMNLVLASAEIDGRQALDVSAVTVDASAPEATIATSSNDVKIELDHNRPHPGDRITVNASLAGAAGDALLTMESARGVTAVVVPASNGTATATLAVPEAIGASAVGVAFVRDGALVNAELTLGIDGPGHPRQTTLTADRADYAPGAMAKITIGDGSDDAGATLAIRVSDRRAASGAAFDDVPGILAPSGTTTQNLASVDPPWHTWVTPAGSKAGDVFGLDRPREAAAPPLESTAAGARVLTWRVARTDGDSFEVAVPHDPGRYVLAVVKIGDDGDVGSASIALTVQ